MHEVVDIHSKGGNRHRSPDTVSVCDHALDKNLFPEGEFSLTCEKWVRDRNLFETKSIKVPLPHENSDEEESVEFVTFEQDILWPTFLKT